MKLLKSRNCGWLIAIFFSLLLTFYLFYDDDLHPDYISSNIQPRPEWAISEPANIAQIEKILDMPFVYLNEGGQSIVFSSVDQRYVLKLFKFRRFRASPFVKLLPAIFPFKAYREQHIAKREQKLIAAFDGYKCAYDLHQIESGLILIQLNPSNHQKLITVIDKEKRKRKINLDKVSYVLQERGEIFSNRLSKILDQGDAQGAKTLLKKILDLYLSEYQKGIYDLDHGVMHNIGCIEDRLFHLDTGKMMVDERMKQPEFYLKDLSKIVSKIQNWIDQKYPKYSAELEIFMNNYLSQT